MIFDIVIFSIVGLWLLVASIFDFKTHEVPDWINFSLIAVGLGARAIYSFVSWDYRYFAYGIFGLVLMLIFGLIMSYTKQWGDGDSKLLIGIGSCLGFNFGFDILNISGWPILLYFFINTLIVGAFYGIFYSIGLSLFNFKNFKREVSRWNFKIFLFPIAFGILLGALSLFFWSDLGRIYLLLVLGLVAAMYVLIFIKIVENSCMYKRLNVNNLVPGDWVAEDVKFKGKMICMKKDVLDEEQIKLLKRSKIKDVLIKQGIPFVPSFLLGFIVSLIFGNLLLYFFI